MFDFDGSKFLIIGIVALLVIGPKDLPRVLRQIGQWTSKLRRMASEFRGQFMDAMREADIDSIKTEVHGVANIAKVDTHFNPLSDLRREIGGIKADLKASTSFTAPTVASSATVATSTAAAVTTIVAPSPVADVGNVISTSAATPTRPRSPVPGAVGSLPGRIPSFGAKSSSS